MRQSLFYTILLVAAAIVSTFIYLRLLPDFIRKGGPLVILLMVLSIMVITFIFERLFSLKKAQGRQSLTTFLRDVEQSLINGNIQEALDRCDSQRGSCANIIRAGLERYQKLIPEKLAAEKKLAETQRAIEETSMLEVPLLEKNLIALSTIASISTMVGLLGTVIGMIRAFRALAHAGAPDAIQLSIGISEALINTAGGLFAAIAAIVAYNFFVNKVDTFTYMIDETSYNVIQILTARTPES